MGNLCEHSYLKEISMVNIQRQTKQVSNAPDNKYALRMKNNFPRLPQHIDQIRQKIRIPQISQIIKDCPIYFIYDKSAIYQGHWKQGQPHGYGRILYQDFSYYEGLIVDGNPDTFINPDHHQDGFYIFADGSYYRGEFKNAKFQGRGAFVAKDNKIKIIGQFHEGLPHGKVNQTIQCQPDQNGRFQFVEQTYEGDYFNGLKSGKGKYQNDRFVYEGEFQNGNFHGQGKLIDFNGLQFIGKFQNGKRAMGQLKSRNGIFRGNCNSADQMGQGFYQWNDGKFYIGTLKKNKLHEIGKIYHQNGRVIQGKWQKGHNKYVSKVQTITPQQVKKIKQQYENTMPTLYYLPSQKGLQTERQSAMGLDDQSEWNHNLSKYRTNKENIENKGQSMRFLNQIN